MDLPYDPEVVVCPNCGSEYQLHVARCIDCGTPTQPSSWTVTNPPPQENAGELPLDAPAVVVRVNSLGGATRLSERLKERGIPCRVEATEVTAKGARYCTCVAESDLEGALEVEQELVLEDLGEAADELVEMPSTDQCPACGSRVSQADLECPECGLVLGGDAAQEDYDEE